jgi:DNA-directed RNA polymerase specialized sigma24 family protein
MLLRLLGGHTIAEIAATLGKTSGADKALPRRALRTLEHHVRHPP